MITASVVLYNTSRSQIDRLLNCLEKSSVVPHLFVIDNSPDSIEHPAFKKPGISYVRAETNLGYGSGHNIALRIVLESSEIHFVLNPDVYFGPKELERMIDFMRRNTDVGELMPHVIYPDGSTQYLCKLLPSPLDLALRRFAPGPLKPWFRKRMERYELRFTGYRDVMDVPYLSGCFMLFRTSALKRVGLFDERFFMYPEDIDITRRMNAEFRTVFFPGATIVHDHARQSYKSLKLLWVHVVNTVKYFNKWGWIRDPARSKANHATLRQFDKNRSPATRGG